MRINGREALDDVVRCLPYGWKASRSSRVDALFSAVVGAPPPASPLRRWHSAYRNATRFVRTLDREELLDRLTTELRVYVAEHSTERTFVHAGAVVWNGRAVVLPGRSFSGKTSLVRELVRLGATYFSDEFAVLDERGRCHPYLKPLSIREPGRVEQTDVDVEALGGVSGTRPAPVGCVVVTEFREGARWRPARLTPGEAALSIFANAVAARRNPAGVAAAASGVVREAIAVRSRRGDASEVASSILEICSR